MYKSSLLALAASISLMGCDGAVCPTVAIPVYDITVYDSVTGDTLCRYQWGGEDHDCEVMISYHDNDRSMADITVTLAGYNSQIQENVANLSTKYICFDQYSYTTDVEFYLNPQ